MRRALLSLWMLLGAAATASAQNAAGVCGALGGQPAGNGAPVVVFTPGGSITCKPVATGTSATHYVPSNDPGLPLPTVVLPAPLTPVAPTPQPKPEPDPALGGLPKVHAAKELTAAELEILARIVKGETWPTASFEAHVAVAAVVLNRLRAPGYPKTLAGVAHQPWQFSCYNQNVRAQLYWGPIREIALRAAKAAAAGADPSKGATHYFNPYLVKPSWAASLTFLKRIGTGPHDTHDFYR